MEPPKESRNVKDYPYFPKTLDMNFVNDKLVLLRRLLWGDQVNPMLAAKIGVYKNSLSETVEMVERRRIYLHIFHRIEMSQYNEIALYCFWILKFQPFFPTDGNIKTASDINAFIAYRLLSSCVRVTRRKNGKMNPISLKMDVVIHALRYQDISKESIMLLMASLIEA